MPYGLKFSFNVNVSAVFVCNVNSSLCEQYLNFSATELFSKLCSVTYHEIVFLKNSKYFPRRWNKAECEAV
jgi:hypothetical protein